MLVAVDPIAGEIILDPENGMEPMTILAKPVFIKIYADGGYLGCAVDGTQIDLYFGVINEEPMEPRLVPVEPDHWRLEFVPRPAS